MILYSKLGHNTIKTSFIGFPQYENLRLGVAVETGKITNVLNKKLMFVRTSLLQCYNKASKSFLTELKQLVASFKVGSIINVNNI